MKFLDFIGGVWEMYNNLNNSQQGYNREYNQGYNQEYGQGYGQGQMDYGAGHENFGQGSNGVGGYGVGMYMQGHVTQPVQFNNTQGLGQQPFYGSQSVSQGSFAPVSTPYNIITQVRPTGGIYAHQLGLNSPYFVPQRGTFRKPTQAEILTEICLATFGTDQGITKNNIEDGGEVIRHVCTSGTLLHYLPRVEYPVTLPNRELVVIYYVHADCGTFTYVGDSLRV